MITSVSVGERGPRESGSSSLEVDVFVLDGRAEELLTIGAPCGQSWFSNLDL